MPGIRIALSLGGNIGDVPATFRKAVEALGKSGLKDIELSAFYKTAPVGCAQGTPDFINAVLTGIWEASLDDLFKLCKFLEEKAGRPLEHPRYASRTLDIDIIFFGDLIYDTPSITIPHKEAANRLFVLVPLADIASDWAFPGLKKKVGDVLECCKKTAEYRRIISNRINTDEMSASL